MAITGIIVKDAPVGHMRSQEAVRATREGLEILRLRAELLQRRDRALVRMFLEHGASYRQIACVAGMSERSVARRIRRIVVRLRNWSYVVLAMQKGLAAFDIAAARLHFVGGLSQREVAIRLGCGRPAVSMALARVRAATGLKTRTRAGIGTGSAGGQEESSREMCA